MIDVHPRLIVHDRRLLIDMEIKEFNLHGDICYEVLDMFYNIFSWVYLEDEFDLDKIKHTKVRNIISKYNLEAFKGPSIAYSTVFFYKTLSKRYNMRSLSNGGGIEISEQDNKLFKRKHFLFNELYSLYKESDGDLSTDFLMFNKIFDKNPEKEVNSIRSVGEVVKTVSKTNLVRPDLGYKMATSQLQVNRINDDILNDEKLIYVLQDCTLSTFKYQTHINMVKAFILNEAFKHDYKVHWIFVERKEVDFQIFDKKTIKQTEIKTVFRGTKVDMTKLLLEDRFLGKQVIIITDGTDPFDFKFNTKTKKINVVSLNENSKIKNKIANYGRFFKVFK